MLQQNTFLEIPEGLKGLRDRIQIWREPNGVVHIKAENDYDLFFAQGFVHAKERLWQMDYQRRIVAGRLAEIFGTPETLQEDIFQRTLGIYRAAENAYTNLPMESKNIVDAYTAGVNAYLDLNLPLPLEFQTLGYSPEPWQPADSLATIKLLSLSLSRNLNFELYRSRLLAQGFSLEQIEAYLSPGDRQLTVLSPTDVANIPGLSVATPSNPLLPAASPIAANFNNNNNLTPTFPQASNNWVVSGNLTATGKPFLASDPHLSLDIPSLWYLVHLESPNYNTIGASSLGAPLIVIGRNDRIAWGVTNSGADVQDLYSLVEATPGQSYIYQGQTLPYQTRQETIAVRGQADVILPVRESIYGPVISDALNLPEPLALEWVSLEPIDSTITAIADINRAGNWQEFVAALDGYIAPSQNFVYADIFGNIGYHLSGQIPIRQPGHTGILPVPGTGEFDWQGFIPQEQMPQIYNPTKGYIVTANNQITPPEYPYLIGNEWAVDYRAERISELITSKQNLTVADMQAIQLDLVSLLTRDFRPILAAIEPTIQNNNNPEAQRWLDLLLQWDGNTTPDSQTATIFQTWYTELSKLAAAVYGREPRPSFILQALNSPDPIYGASIAQSLETAANIFVTVVDSFAGVVPAWGEIHQANFDHPFLPIERNLPFGGDDYTVNVGPYNLDNFLMEFGPSYRQIIDLADPNNSLFIHPMGQSEAQSSPYFENLLVPWQQGDYLPMLSNGYQIAESSSILPRPRDLHFGSQQVDRSIAVSGVALDSFQDSIFTGAGADVVDFSQVTDFFIGNNHILTGSNDDTIFVNKSDRAFGGEGNDIFYANSGQGNNLLFGNNGNDVFFLGSNDRVVGGDGDDTIFLNNDLNAGGNTITGGEGSDRFAIVNAQSQLNLITDFQVGVDIIGIDANINISPADIITRIDGSDTIISVAGVDIVRLINVDPASLPALIPIA